MISKKIKIAILDEDDNVLKSMNTILKWKEDVQEDMMNFHGLNMQNESIDLIFTNVVKSMENIGLKEEQWGELRNEK